MTKSTAANIATLTVAIARVTDKSTGTFLGYIAQPSEPRNPDGTVKAWYEVTWNPLALRWECRCESRKPCKHIAAVEAGIAERKAADEATTEPVASPAPATRRTARIAPERVATPEAMPPVNAAMASVFAKPATDNPHAASAALFAKFRQDASKPDEAEAQARASFASMSASYATQQAEWQSMSTVERQASIDAERRRSQAPLNGRRGFSLMR